MTFAKLYFMTIFLCIRVFIDGTYLRTGCYSQVQSITCNHIPDSLPERVTHVYLKEIDLQNEVLEFSSPAWANITNLDITSYKGEYIRRKGKSIFDRFVSLRVLGIHASELKSIDSDTFDQLPYLKKLDLSGCLSLRFEDIVNALTFPSSLENIESLDIEDVNSKYPVDLDDKFFDPLSKRPIKYLSVSGLNVLHFDFSAMYKLCNTLEIMNISNTLYTPAFTGLFGKLPSDCLSLQVLDASSLNAIFSVKEEVTIASYGYPSLKTVYLNSLKFRNFHDNRFVGDSIVLDGLNITCVDCSIENIKHLYLKSNKLRWLNATGNNFKNLTLSLLDLSENKMEYISPDLLNEIVTLENLNFGRNRLHVMEKYKEFEKLFSAFTKLSQLSLSENDLTVLPKYIFSQNVNLEHLDISHNKLKSLSLSFESLSKLKHLNLKGNKLAVLNADNLTLFMKFIESKLDLPDANFSVNLTSNPLSCSCEGSQFIKWLYVFLIPRQNLTLTCVYGKARKVIDNSAVVESLNDCSATSRITAFTALSLCLLASLVVLCVLAITYIRRRSHERKRTLIIRELKEKITNFKYFVFLIFCQKDEVFIHHQVSPHLLDSLRNTIDTNGKRICEGFLEYRLGLAIANETERCIRESMVVVYVISSASCTCIRCRRELKMAYDKDKPVAVLYKENVGEENVYPLLEIFIKRHNTIVVTGNRVNDHQKLEKRTFCQFLMDMAADNS